MRKKSTMKLLQALIPEPTARRVMVAAKREGISTGAFIRRMLLEWERTVYRTRCGCGDSNCNDCAGEPR